MNLFLIKMKKKYLLKHSVVGCMLNGIPLKLRYPHLDKLHFLLNF